VRADGEERGVVTAFLHRSCHIGDLGVELDGDAHLDDARHLGVEDVARQPVLRNAEAHHPAQARPGVHHRDGMPLAAQLVGGRHARRAGADDQHVPPRLLPGAG
jgi:hypothetical protein